jgi:ribosome maturation factor RimP
MSESVHNETKKISVFTDLSPVREIVEPLVGAHGLSLYDIEWTNGPQGKILRVTIERRLPDDIGDRVDESIQEGGVTLEDCVAVSRDVSTALDAVELIPQQYNLEVSSPGLDRPLVTSGDFARQIGRLAKLRLKAPASDGQHVLRGELAEAGDDGIAIVVDGKRHEVPLDNIQHAKLVFELGGQKKKGQRKQKKRSSGRQRKRKGSRGGAAAGRGTTGS